MFGSISNWINTNIPQVPTVNMPNISMPNMPNISMPTMPNMPSINMPNINMPNINIPDIFNKNKEGDATTAEQQQTGDEQQVTSAQQQQEQQIKESVADATADQQQPTTSADAAAAAAEAGDDAQKFNLNPLDIDAKKTLGQAKELTSNFGNMLFSLGKNASNNMMKTATHLKDVIEKKTIIGDFNKENEKFVNEKKVQQRREDSALPPWVGYNEEDILKEQILELSQDSRNFLRSPPPGVDYNFDFNLAYPIALVTLEEDKNLKDMRFKLVPKHINEESFWRNYFYRVSLIKQSTQLDQLNNENQNSNNNSNDEDEPTPKQTVAPKLSASTNQQNESMGAGNNEFVSDSYDHEALNDQDLQEELKQLKLDNKKTDDLEDWDKELPEDLDSISAEELEKEINQMIGK